MSRKDFVAIAEALASRYRAGDAQERATVSAVASDLCAVFKSANSRFDRERFMRAVTGE